MECSICLIQPEDVYISCKRYGCELIICGECANMMVSVCYSQINSKPSCECNCEYLSSQLSPVLTKKSMEMYISICAKSNDSVKKSIEDRRITIAIMLEKVKAQTRSDLFDSLPAGLAKLIIISGLEAKRIARQAMIAEVKRNIKNMSFKRCVSFICNGKLLDHNDCLKCTKCGLLVCKDCDVVRSEEHTCDPDNVENVKILNKIAKCPNCNVPATKGEGCIFITCPYCKVNFNSSSGVRTGHGGHNDGKIKPMRLYNNLSDIVTDENIEAKIILNKIESAKTNFEGSSSKRPDRVYEAKYRLGLYHQTINRIYELRDIKMLNNETLKNILKYIETI